MTRQLNVGFMLPIDIITDKIAVLSQSGAGKTTAGVDIAEELHKLAQQFIVLDPKGDWHGIRSSADGKSPGLPVTVFGGLHGDLPIYPESGKTVANLIVEEGISAVVDVSDFETDGQRHRFTTEFAKSFYKAKQRKKSPVLFIIEEADESLPQQMVESTEAQMVGAIKRIAKLGRFCGIGVMMISQRAADVNKKALSQMQVLIVMRTWHETDLKAIKGALKDQVTKELFDEIISALPSLETGEAYVVAPHRGIKKKVKFRLRETFDAGETPKVGQMRREPKVLAPVQLEALKQRLSAEVERAKAEDPKELKAKLKAAEAQIAKLQKQPSAKPATITKTETKVEVKEVSALAPEDRKLLEKVAAVLDLDMRKHRHGIEVAQEHLAAVDVVSKRIAAAMAKTPAKNGAAYDFDGTKDYVMRPVVRQAVQVRPASTARPAPAKRQATVQVTEEGLSAPQQRILDALALLESVRVERANRVQLALLAEASPKSSAYVNNLGALRNQEGKYPWPVLIDYPGQGEVCLTEEGRSRAHAPEQAPTTEDLHRTLQGLLPAPQWRIIEALVAKYPEALSRDELAEASGASPTSSAFVNNLGALRSFKFIDYPGKGLVAAQPVLFLGD